jgi:hypothetical protein
MQQRNNQVQKLERRLSDVTSALDEANAKCKLMESLLESRNNISSAQQSAQQESEQLQARLARVTADLEETQRAYSNARSALSASEDAQRQQQQMKATVLRDSSDNETREYMLQCSRLETRCALLTQQIQSMPVSLNVANAEKRVLEGKLEKAVISSENTVRKIQIEATTRIKELEAFAAIEVIVIIDVIDALQDDVF